MLTLVRRKRLVVLEINREMLNKTEVPPMDILQKLNQTKLSNAELNYLMLNQAMLSQTELNVVALSQTKLCQTKLSQSLPSIRVIKRRAAQASLDINVKAISRRCRAHGRSS